MTLRRQAVAIVVIGLSVLVSSRLIGLAQDKPGSIKVRVELVSLNLIVSDAVGRYIPGLKKENFRIYEDNVEQQITHFAPIDQPFNVALVLDTSSSMREYLARIQDESIRFVDLLHPDDEVAVVSFDDEVHLECPVTLDRKRILRGIKSTRTGESTQVYEGVYLTLDQVLKPRQGRKAMVLFTDGVDTSSRDTSQKDTYRLAEETEAIIYPIKFNTLEDVLYQGQPRPGVTVGPGVQIPMPGPSIGIGRPTMGGMSRASIEGDYARASEYLKQLAEKSGGRVFDANKIDDLGRAFEQVAEELRNQYSIAYATSNPKRDGKFRKIRIVVDQPGAVVRSRKGYYAPKT